MLGGFSGGTTGFTPFQAGPPARISVGGLEGSAPMHCLRTRHAPVFSARLETALGGPRPLRAEGRF